MMLSGLVDLGWLRQCACFSESARDAQGRAGLRSQLDLNVRASAADADAGSIITGGGSRGGTQPGRRR